MEEVLRAIGKRRSGRPRVGWWLKDVSMSRVVKGTEEIREAHAFREGNGAVGEVAAVVPCR